MGQYMKERYLVCDLVFVTLSALLITPTTYYL